LYKNHVLKGTEPNWEKGEHPTQRPYWEAFVSWKKSEESLSISRVNTNSHKNDNPHWCGSRGYTKKVHEWEKIQELVQKGVTSQTVGWDPCELRYLLARKMTYNDDSSLSFPNNAVWELAERIQATQAQVKDGTFFPEREDDVLSRALGTKEHPGQARVGSMAYCLRKRPSHVQKSWEE
jgi:hypothetical protein